ncbi:MAG TPA: protease [Bacteroidetes bacterium]|nr:protease [Bacteroidota bacterium]HIL56687.1 protease [Rhodothermales bacterium]
MTTLYWACLGGGFAFSLLLLLFDGLLDGALDALDGALGSFDLDGVFDPLSAVAGATIFGAAGLVLDSAMGLGTTAQLIVAGAIGVLAAVVMHVAYVKPMKQSENSTGFSQEEYVGKTGEANTSIPASGFGEVVIRMGASTTFQTAASFDGTPIPDGTRVVVVEVERDGVLRVSALTAEEAAHSPLAERPRPRLELGA